jgi:hypothetical protein
VVPSPADVVAIDLTDAESEASEEKQPDARQPG